MARRLKVSPYCCTLLLHHDQKGRFLIWNRPLSWSPVTESNRRPSPYHGDALPTELTGPVLTCLTCSFARFGLYRTLTHRRYDI